MYKWRRYKKGKHGTQNTSGRNWVSGEKKKHNAEIASLIKMGVQKKLRSIHESKTKKDEEQTSMKAAVIVMLQEIGDLS